MELRLERRPSTTSATLGRLWMAECVTLENVVRDGPKLDDETAIPEGRYRVTVTMSQRFGRMMPLINDVPGFTGIRIHSGNTAEDTSGCVLVGQVERDGHIYGSRLALQALQSKIGAALASGDEVWIEVVNAEWPAVEPLRELNA